LGPDCDQKWHIALGEHDAWRQMGDLAGQERALAKLLRLTNTPSRKAVYFNRLARLRWEAGAYEDSLEAASRALAAARRARDVGEQAGALAGLAQVYYNTGRLREAEECLALGQALADCPAQVRAHMLNMRGAVAAARGETAASKTYYSQALGVRRAIGDRWGEAQTLGNLALIAADEGDFSTALVQLERTLSLWRQIGDPVYQAIVQVNLGDVARHIGEYGLARKHLRAAASAFRAYGRADGLFHALHNLAGVEIDCGEWLDAETRLWALLSDPSASSEPAQSLPKGQALEDDRTRAMVLADLAYLCLRRGDAQAAREHAGQAAELWRELGNRPNLSVAQALLADAGWLDMDAWLEQARDEKALIGAEAPPHMAWLLWHRGLRSAGYATQARQAIRLGVGALFDQVKRLIHIRHRRCFLETWLAAETLRAWDVAVLGAPGNGAEAVWSGLELWRLELGDLAVRYLDYALDEIEAGRYEPSGADMDAIEAAYTDIYGGESR
jgi:tetratricopeptide (TPR) repeat protein